MFQIIFCLFLSYDLLTSFLEKVIFGTLIRGDLVEESMRFICQIILILPVISFPSSELFFTLTYSQFHHSDLCINARIKQTMIILHQVLTTQTMFAKQKTISLNCVLRILIVHH